MTLEGDDYKRPKPSPDVRCARFMSKKNFICSRSVPVGPELFDKNLGYAVRETLQTLLPLYNYFSLLE